MLSNEGDEMLEGKENKLETADNNIVTVEAILFEKNSVRMEAEEEKEDDIKNKEIVIVNFVNINQSSQEPSIEFGPLLEKSAMELSRSLLENPQVGNLSADLVAANSPSEIMGINPQISVENPLKVLPPLSNLINSISNLECGDKHVSVPSIKSSSFPNQSFYVETSDTESLTENTK